MARTIWIVTVDSRTTARWRPRHCCYRRGRGGASPGCLMRARRPSHTMTCAGARTASRSPATRGRTDGDLHQELLRPQDPAYQAWEGQGLRSEPVREMLIEAVEKRFGDIDGISETHALEFLSDKGRLHRLSQPHRTPRESWPGDIKPVQVFIRIPR